MQRLIEQLQRREIAEPQAARATGARSPGRRARACQGARPDAAVRRDGGRDAWVEADPERLTMIVEHVIRNAQEATPARTVRVTCRAWRCAARPRTAEARAGRPDTHSRAAGADGVALTVTDTGAGMTREFIQERLFKPFDTTKGSKGMGIGAYQVREYVQSLGGRVDVGARPGRGRGLPSGCP